MVGFKEKGGWLKSLKTWKEVYLKKIDAVETKTSLTSKGGFEFSKQRLLFNKHQNEFYERRKAFENLELFKEELNS